MTRKSSQPGTHGARLQGAVEGNADEPPVVQERGRILQCYHLGMGGGVLATFFAVVPRADDLPLPDRYRPHRNLIECGRELRAIMYT